MSREALEITPGSLAGAHAAHTEPGRDRQALAGPRGDEPDDVASGAVPARAGWAIGVAWAVLAVAALVALSLGGAGFRQFALGDLLAGDDIVAGLRAPRVALAGLVGAGLALAGLSMQTMLGNDLADPYVLGVSGGAAAGAVTSLALAPGLDPGPAAAVGAAAAAALVRGLAGGAHDSTRLLLAGVTTGSLLGSATGLVLVLAPGERMLRTATHWLFGGLGTPTPAALLPPAVLLVGAFVFLRVRATRLDRMLLGDDTARTLGVDVQSLRLWLIVIGVALTAAAVAAGGLIGFVGLVAPHAARRLVGPGHRALVALAALLGAIVLVLSDTAARTAFAPREVPVGLVTAAAGGPFFLWLLRRRTSEAAR